MRDTLNLKNDIFGKIILCLERYESLVNVTKYMQIDSSLSLSIYSFEHDKNVQRSFSGARSNASITFLSALKKRVPNCRKLLRPVELR